MSFNYWPVTPSGGVVTGVTGTAPIAATAGATPVISIAAFTGDSGAGGAKGAVPAPAAGDAAAGKYLAAGGGFSVPAGGGGGAGSLVLLESHTASTSATLNFTTRNATGQSGATFQSDYDEYQIEVLNLLPATNATNLILRMSTNGGSSYDTGNNYNTTCLRWTQGATGTGGSITTYISLDGDSGLNEVSNTLAGGGVVGSYKLYSPLSTTVQKRMIGQAAFWGTVFVGTAISGTYVSTTAVNAFQVLAVSGNLASGIVRVYGVAK